MEKGLEFFYMTGQFPKLEKWGNPPPIPLIAIKPNIFDLEKALSIKREPDFWELIKEYIKNKIEDDMFFDICLKASSK